MPADRAGSADPGRLRAESANLLRRYSLDSFRISQAFAVRHHMPHADLRALVSVLGAEDAGAPLSPSALSADLGLSSSGTSYVLDRLERAGHVHRVREDDDRRVVRVRHGPHGRDIADEFFGPLEDRVDSVVARLTDDELRVVHVFLSEMVDVLEAHLLAVQAR